ncbi:MAG: hypothetical protein FWC38_07820 [Proteobacteria bacterium]|nr:hypothetical protein [Pseudomonadota bacterium]
MCRYPRESKRSNRSPDKRSAIRESGARGQRSADVARISEAPSGNQGPEVRGQQT